MHFFCIFALIIFFDKGIFALNQYFLDENAIFHISFIVQ